MIIFTVIAWRWIWRGKPVQINPTYYKNQIKWEFLTSLAGPAMNILLAIIWLIIAFIYMKITWLSINAINMNNWDIITLFRVSFSVLNIVLAVFNILPIYPLDGYRIIKILKPSAWFWMERNWQVITIIFLFLILGTGIFWSIIWKIVEFIFGLFVTIIWSIFY